MSTVAEFLEEIIDRIPEEKASRLYPALNRALRILAKRLYVLESHLVKDELSVPIYASVEYAVDTLAFVSNQPEASDTITDSAAQFVAEGFQAGMPIETDFTTNPGPYRLTAVAVGTLTLASTDILTAQTAGDDYTLASRDDFGYLPSDFWGFFGKAKPYVYGKTWPLLPLPSQDEKLAWGSAGEARFYELIGDRLYVTPATSSDITVKGLYFKRPAKITKETDIIPYQELFDDILQEYLVEILNAGTATGAAIQDQLMLSVDLVVSKMPQKAAASMTQAIDWNNL